MILATNRPKVEFLFHGNSNQQEEDLFPGQILPARRRQQLLSADLTFLRIHGDQTLGFTSFHENSVWWAIAAASLNILWLSTATVDPEEIWAEVRPCLVAKSFVTIIECHPESGLPWADLIERVRSDGSRIFFIYSPRPVRPSRSLATH